MMSRGRGDSLPPPAPGNGGNPRISHPYPPPTRMQMPHDIALSVSWGFSVRTGSREVETDLLGADGQILVPRYGDGPAYLCPFVRTGGG